MVRYFLQISFHGKKYHGWQVQANAHTVQAEINAALSVLLKQETKTLGCCRTDTGVHAQKYFCQFDCSEAVLSGKDFLYHLNCLLPQDISADRLVAVEKRISARHDAFERTYRYFIHQVKNPFYNEVSFFYPLPLDLERMNEAAAKLVLYKDFRCFAKSGNQSSDFHCHVKSAAWKKKGNQLVFEITANRFLRNMVRAITGTLLKCGRNEISIAEFDGIIKSGKRSNAGMSVPGLGLHLTDVKYPFIK